MGELVLLLFIRNSIVPKGSLKVVQWLSLGCPEVKLRLPKSNISINQKEKNDVDRKFQISLNLKPKTCPRVC